MNSFDPDFSGISNEQLARIDSLCSEYESKRTRGGDVKIEQFLHQAPLEIRAPLLLELIQIEMEILETWDQLNSPDDLIQLFPEQQEFIHRCWQTFKSNIERDAACNTKSEGSTQGDGRSEQAPIGLDDTSAPEDPSPRFRIIRNLAQGGIGTLYVAFDRDLQRHVAIKELKRKFANVQPIVQRFEAEATVTGNLEHPNIVPIYATGRRSDGRPYYAMRLIQGRSMQAAIAELHRDHRSNLDFKTNPAARDILLRFVTVCRAIGFAHSRGIVHRDLKPSNIMVGDFGETLVVDWGLARDLRIMDPPATEPQQTESLSGHASLPAASERTSHGTVIGTPGYMSPEQAGGQHAELTITSDIYSLGATLFQILANKVPSAVTVSTLEKARPVQRTREAWIAPPLFAICNKAMQLEPAMRYGNAENLANDLEAWLLDEPVSVLPDTSLQKARRWAKAHPSLVAGGLASLLITLLAMGITLSLLSAKNESLRLSNLREQVSAKESADNASIAKKNGDEAVRQRQRVLGVLNTFLLDVERGLSNVPGGAAVQRNVLTTVLNKLAEISKDFAEDDVNQSNAMAIVDLGDLFSRVGTKEIKLDLPNANKMALSPLEAAGEMYAEAMKITIRSGSQDSNASRRMIAMIKQKQAEVLRQTARTPEAIPLLEESLSMRRALLAESPESVDAAMDVVTTVDYRGQIYLQNGDFVPAKNAFSENESILTRLSSSSPNDFEINRKLGVTLSRLGDIAVHDGDMDLATKLYERDLAIASELVLSRPNNLTAKRDFCTSLDRIGNLSATRGQLEKAMESYLESRRLREELHAAEPTNFKTSHDLMVSYLKAGDTRMLLKQVALAQADYVKTLALADELAQADPQNAIARRFQSISAEVLADVAIELSQLDDALKYAQKSLAISLELVAKDPTDGQMKRDLYICYVKVAKVLLARKDFEDCETQMNLALKIVQSAYERQPESLQTFGDYSFVLLKRAQAFLEAGKATLAIKELETVIPLLESIPEANRQDAKSRRRIANAVTMLGRAFLSEGQTENARNAFERSRMLTIAMIDENMRVEQMQLDLEEIDSLIKGLDN